VKSILIPSIPLLNVGCVEINLMGVNMILLSLKERGGVNNGRG
jgi:hypothetical protein